MNLEELQEELKMIKRVISIEESFREKVPERLKYALSAYDIDIDEFLLDEKTQDIIVTEVSYTLQKLYTNEVVYYLQRETPVINKVISQELNCGVINELKFKIKYDNVSFFSKFKSLNVEIQPMRVVTEYETNPVTLSDYVLILKKQINKVNTKSIYAKTGDDIKVKYDEDWISISGTSKKRGESN